MDREHAQAAGRQRRRLSHNGAGFIRYRPELLTLAAFSEVVLDFARWSEFRFDTVLWDVDGGEGISLGKIELDLYPQTGR